MLQPGMGRCEVCYSVYVQKCDVLIPVKAQGRCARAGARADVECPFAAVGMSVPQCGSR